VTSGQLTQRAGSLGLNGGGTAAAVPPDMRMSLLTSMPQTTRWRSIQFHATNSPTVACLCKLQAFTAVNWLLCGRWRILYTWFS